MDNSALKVNTFLFFKLPAAFWCGVRLKTINESDCTTTVRHRWFNQNPFRSLYFAVQAMAAELSTGALVLYHIRNSGRNVSMLVANNKCHFTKKATGKITFRCTDGQHIAGTVKQAIATGEGQTLWMKSIGTDEKGDTVSQMEFEWTLRLKPGHR